jgi:hypothetical protein
METAIQIRNRRMNQLKEAWLVIQNETAKLAGSGNWEDAETGRERWADLDQSLLDIVMTGCWLNHSDIYSDMGKELFDQWLNIFDVCTIAEFFRYSESIQTYIVEDFSVHFWALGTGEWMDRESPSKSEKDWSVN